MDFSDQVKSLASRIPRLVENIKTEEGAKNALIMPFINALGYNVFDSRYVAYISTPGKSTWASSRKIERR